MNRTLSEVSPEVVHSEVANPEVVLDVECSTYQECLDQAEICCEQARGAAGLKRFKAACGLFMTSLTLCRRAVALGGDACIDAQIKLKQINDELLVYSELAKSMERPIAKRRPLAAKLREVKRRPVEGLH